MQDNLGFTQNHAESVRVAPLLNKIAHNSLFPWPTKSEKSARP